MKKCMKGWVREVRLLLKVMGGRMKPNDLLTQGVNRIAGYHGDVLVGVGVITNLMVGDSF